MGAWSMLEDLLKSGSSGSWDRKSLATGAAAGGALALLLGSRRGRAVGGQVLKIGSVAALGALAYQAYQRYQQEHQAAAGGTGVPAATPASAAPAPFEALPAPEREAHGQAMLKAMIAAAKSDGHLDERERGLLEAELARSNADEATRRWFEDELRKPIDPVEVAAAATTPQMGSEVYLASLLVIDQTSTMERAYLEELARQLRLAPALKAELEAQASAA